MLRTLLGSAIGLLVGLGLGFILLSTSGNRTAPTLSEQPAQGEIFSAESTEQGELQAPQKLAAPEKMTAASEAPKMPSISESSMQALLARIALQPSERRRGELEFWGRVSDANGAGLGGVRVCATADDAMASLQKFGETQNGSKPATLDETVRRAAQEFQDANARRFCGTTNSEGDFRLTDIPAGSFYLQAFKDSYTLHVQGQPFRSIPAGNEVNFSAIELVELDVSITLPNGSVPELAIVQSKSERDGHTRSQSWVWSPNDQRLHLPATEVELTAYAGIANYFRQVDTSASLLSESVTLNLATNAPKHVELVLAGREGIRGRVTFAEDLLITTDAWVRLLPLGDHGDLDLNLLANAQAYKNVQNQSEFSFLDLAPGRYAVGISRTWQAPIEAHEVLTVKKGITRGDLILPQLDPSKFIRLQVFDPDGKTLPSLRFGMRQIENGEARISNSGIQGLRTKDGSYFITVPKNIRPAFYGEPNESMTFSLSARHVDYGSRSTYLAAGQTHAQIQLNEGADLKFTIVGLVNGPYTGRVSALLHAREGNQNYLYSTNPIDPSSILTYGKQAPGEYDLDLRLSKTSERHSQSHTIASVRVLLKAGFNAVEMVMPALYSLNVLVPGAPPGTRLYLQKLNTEQDQPQGNRNTICEDDGEFQFMDLRAGEYSLRVSTGLLRGSMNISVPCRSIVFEPDKK